MLPISNGRQLVAEDDSRRVGPEGVVTWRVWISRELDRNGDEDEEQQKAVKAKQSWVGTSAFINSYRSDVLCEIRVHETACFISDRRLHWRLLSSFHTLHGGVCNSQSQLFLIPPI
nr:hypothetical protein Iba_chr02fCG2260 [Ipomoea batatas]